VSCRGSDQNPGRPASILSQAQMSLASFDAASGRGWRVTQGPLRGCDQSVAAIDERLQRSFAIAPPAFPRKAVRKRREQLALGLGLGDDKRTQTGVV
jgi:hypothetical protein